MKIETKNQMILALIIIVANLTLGIALSSLINAQGIFILSFIIVVGLATAQSISSLRRNGYKGSLKELVLSNIKELR